ncbi:hypothetical protein [Microbulbifer taiwanensis]|uniref:hypothetical protein n=1 Tax=Microbulbifer taiwanensis TaxID=986746 RepID=UPI00361ED4F3
MLDVHYGGVANDDVRLVPGSGLEGTSEMAARTARAAVNSFFIAGITWLRGAGRYIALARHLQIRYLYPKYPFL